MSSQVEKTPDIAPASLRPPPRSMHSANNRPALRSRRSSGFLSLFASSVSSCLPFRRTTAPRHWGPAVTHDGSISSDDESTMQAPPKRPLRAQGSLMSMRSYANLKPEAPPKAIGPASPAPTPAPADAIDLSVAENLLLREEMSAFCAETLSKLDPATLSLADAMNGPSDLTRALATFFNRHFAPATPLTSDNVVVSSGVASCLNALIYNICDPGDAVLCLAPYWHMIDTLLAVSSSTTVIPVPTPTFSELDADPLTPVLEAALTAASSKAPVRALVLTNPANPTGTILPQRALEAALAFCIRHDLHLVSDEIYALTSHRPAAPGAPAPTPFTPVLSLADPAAAPRVHALWSPSKSLGLSGARLGAVATHSPQLARALSASCAHTVSRLAAAPVTALLADPRLPALLATGRDRLAANTARLTALLTAAGLPFVAPDAGLFVFARLAPAASNADAEAAMLAGLRAAGVLVAPGHAFHVHADMYGWARVCVAVPESALAEACARIAKFLFTAGLLDLPVLASVAE